jgi:hypothetical protein
LDFLFFFIFGFLTNELTGNSDSAVTAVGSSRFYHSNVNDINYSVNSLDSYCFHLSYKLLIIS